MDAVLQDLRYAIRLCLRTPGFTAIAVLALALGIGANTAIFTFVNAVLLEPLPFRDPGRLVVMWETNARRPGQTNTIGPANFVRWRERATAFERMAPFYDYRTNLTGAGAPEEVIGMDVTPDFFPTLGVAPLVGRAFSGDEGPEGHDAVAVLSYGLWKRRFAGNPAIVGQTIQLNSRGVTIVGVMPADMRLFVKRWSLTGKPADLWMPFAFTEASREPRGRYLTAIARLKQGTALTEAQAQMDTIASGLTKEFPQFDTGWGALLVPMHRELSGDLRSALLVLTGAVGFVLLIACANVANLLLARGATRQREMAIRAALGAGRIRVIRQLLTESLVLCTLGGGFGLLVAAWGLEFLLAISPVSLVDLGPVHLSYPVLGFTAAVSIATAIACGFAPAFEGARGSVHDALKDGARQIGAGIRHRRIRHALVIGEIALAVVLLVGAGLMIRSFSTLRSVNPGFDARNVLTARVTIPTRRYPDDAKRIDFFATLVARLSAIPGVESAGAVSYLPLAGPGAGTSFEIVGQPPPLPGQSPATDVSVCDNGYFSAMKGPLLRGRLFTGRELREKSNVVVINEALARRYFPGANALGKSLVIAMSLRNVPTEIIGVVGDVKFSDLAAETRPMTYWPPPQLAYSAMTLTVRTGSDPAAFAPLVEREVRAMDKDQPVADVRTMDQWVIRTLAQARFSSMLLTTFAALALALAAIGVYGVMSYAVSQRTSEIGIRLALGAKARDIHGMVVGQAVRLAATGLGIGVVLALALSRTLTSLLYETAGTEPVTFAAVVMVLGAVAIAASYFPARRAARIPPVEALRAQ
ncbi:MAG TPA: ABC transporter permease [Vicinamibacterales bacterium]|nr:ABC transporter permease [Vicinamibacterales bacterium]